MIRSFGNDATADFWHRRNTSKSRRIPAKIHSVARRKLSMIEAANALTDLARPPANRLESLAGNMAGKHSIRINDQRRIVFKWEDGGAVEVEIVDYH